MSIPQMPMALVPHSSRSLATLLFSLNLSTPMGAPCTTTGFMPTVFKRAISLISSCSPTGLMYFLQPYSMTATCRLKSLI